MTSTLHVYNTQSRSLERFETIEPGKVRMYVCGVTPYASAHIGHAMSAIVFDVIKRYLLFLGYEVRHAINFTDIDDKIIARATEQGRSPDELTEELILDWLRELGDLNVLPATVYPRATHEIPEIIATIEGLVLGGHAYERDGDVYYRVRSFGGYGKLSHRSVDDMLSGARIDVDERKDDPLDFALWKAAKPGEPRWSSPWGDGRPGWHIECSAMCAHHLGGAVDIHGGGADLIFPHHENEIAQSEAYLGIEPFARYWVHNGLLQLGTEKMSKSIGDMVSVDDLVSRGRQNAFRLFVLQSHYRKPLTYTETALEAAHTGYERLRAAAFNVVPGEAPDSAMDEPIRAAFAQAMDDDFDTSRAVANLFDLARDINRRAASGGEVTALRRSLAIALTTLGFDLAAVDEPVDDDIVPFVEVLLTVREELRAARQWALADRIRDELARLGVAIADAPTGATWQRSR